MSDEEPRKTRHFFPWVPYHPSPEALIDYLHAKGHRVGRIVISTASQSDAFCGSAEIFPDEEGA